MSQIGKNTTFGPFAVRYFPFSHCQISLIYSYLIYKNAATLITVSIRKKRPLRLIAVRVFSLYALSKNFNQLFPSSKTPQHQAICSQTGKNATSRQLCRYVFRPCTVKNLYLYSVQKSTILYYLPQQLGIHTVPIIGENLQ